MSPEQAEGAAIDVRTDLYSLGVILYELITGGLPFTGATPLVTAAARLIKPPPDPRQRRPGLPDVLANFLLRCLAQKPQDRFASAQELSDAFAAAVQLIAANTSGGLATVIGSRVSGAHALISAQPELSVDGRTGLSGDYGQTMAAEPAAKSVAVMPFRNQGSPGDEYLAEGLTDDLRDALSTIKGLRLLSGGSVEKYREAQEPQVVGQALGVDVLVFGSVRRQGNVLRVSVRLVQTIDGVQSWAQRFDRPDAEALGISDEAATAIAGILTGGTAALQREVLRDAQAVDLYLRARALYQRSDRQSLTECISLYELALKLQPKDPQLLTGYALALGRVWFFGAEGSGERALAAAEQAVAMAPERGDSHLALAAVRFNSCDAVGAVSELLIAVKRAPTLADAHDLLGRILVETGPSSRGLQHLEHAFELEPRLARTLVDRARLDALEGNWDAAERLLTEAQKLGGAPMPIWIMRGRLLLWQRNSARAKALLEHPDMTSDRYRIPQRLLQVVAGAHRYEVHEILDGVVASDNASPRGRLFHYQVDVELQSFYEQPDLAIRSLARAVDIGFFDISWYDHCPILELMRTDVRFKVLRKIVGVRASKVHQLLRQQVS